VSEGPGAVGAVSGADSRERIVLARSAHTLRLVDALDHASGALRGAPAQDFTTTLSTRLGGNDKPDAQAPAEVADGEASDAPRLDFMRTSVLRGHVSQPGSFNPDPNAAPLPELPREREAAQGPAPDVVRADEIAALSAMLDADRAPAARPPLDALAQSETNLLPPDVLQDLHQRHLAREAQGNAGNGWPLPGSVNGGGDDR
jgi:hypothetical protein